MARLWSGGRTKIAKQFQKRILIRLDMLEAADEVSEMNLPGYNFHALHGKPQRYTMHVNGPWCITFEFENGDAHAVDFEQYH